MKSAIIEYYKSLNVPIPLIVRRRPYGLTPAQVKQACVNFYDNRDGQPNMRTYVREIYKEAQKVSGKEFEKQEALARDSINMIQKQRRLIYYLLALCASLVLYGGFV